MTDKRYLFRGFHTDENGNTTITLNGKKIKGEWYYGLPAYGDHTNEEVGYIEYEPCRYIKIIPETIGQWSTTDKNGKDLFFGDIVKCKHTLRGKSCTKEEALSKKPRHSYGHLVKENVFGILGLWDIEYWRNYEIVYDNISMRIKIKNGSDYHYLCWSYIKYHDIEIIGNKWECTE